MSNRGFTFFFFGRGCLARNLGHKFSDFGRKFSRSENKNLLENKIPDYRVNKKG